jgi:uncharacterized protein
MNYTFSAGACCSICPAALPQAVFESRAFGAEQIPSMGGTCSRSSASPHDFSQLRCGIKAGLPPLPNSVWTLHYSMADPTNVLGGKLECCCRNPITGFYRDGYCRTGPGDDGLHTVCAIMTDEFLEFSTERGNDLSTPVPEYDFPGLISGDRWCLCVTRWQEAFEAGCAPPVVLEATHISALEFVSLEDLRAHAAQF